MLYSTNGQTLFKSLDTRCSFCMPRPPVRPRTKRGQHKEIRQSYSLVQFIAQEERLTFIRFIRQYHQVINYKMKKIFLNDVHKAGLIDVINLPGHKLKNLYTAEIFAHWVSFFCLNLWGNVFCASISLRSANDFNRDQT